MLARVATRSERCRRCSTRSLEGGRHVRTLTLKTRSGKIMRRILRKIAENEFGSLGDTSTLADPSVVDDLIDKRKANQ